MSFSFQFQCNRSEVEGKLSSEKAPDSVKEFVRTAAASLKSDSVAVSCHGHLHDGSEHDYKVSNVTIEVKPADGR